MRRSSVAASWLSVIFGAVLVLSTAACASGSVPDTALSDSSASTDAAASTDPETATETPDDNDAAVCSDSEFVDAAPIPTQFSDLDVPFYPCAHEMVALTGDDLIFVGEYVTNHEMIIVEMAVTDQFDASDWEVTDRSVEGDMAITTAQKPGYSLVIAIGPTRASDTDSSLHYTLRAQ